jgi:hypothetical protein
MTKFERLAVPEVTSVVPSSLQSCNRSGNTSRVQLPPGTLERERFPLTPVTPSRGPAQRKTSGNETDDQEPANQKTSDSEGPTAERVLAWGIPSPKGSLILDAVRIILVRCAIRVNRAIGVTASRSSWVDALSLFLRVTGSENAVSRDARPSLGATWSGSSRCRRRRRQSRKGVRLPGPRPRTMLKSQLFPQ